MNLAQPTKEPWSISHVALGSVTFNAPGFGSDDQCQAKARPRHSENQLAVAKSKALGLKNRLMWNRTGMRNPKPFLGVQKTTDWH